MIENGYWPCSVENVTSIVHLDVFEFWNSLQKLQPNSSESCFIHVLEGISDSNGRFR